MQYVTPELQEELRRRYKVCNLIREGEVTNCLLYPRNRWIRGTMRVTVRTRSASRTSPLRVKEVCEALVLLADRVPHHAVSVRIDHGYGPPSYGISSL